MATTMEIVNGISQVMANSYDGALDEKGEPIKVGLKREEGHPIHDSRVMDGFKVQFAGNQICIHYHSEIKLKDVHDNNFENDLEDMIGKIASFLKKEYKKITGKALSLKADGDVTATVETSSRHRCWVRANQYFDLSGQAEAVKGESKDSVDAKFKDFLSQGGWKKADPQGQPVHVGDGKVQSRKDIHSPYKDE